MSRRLERKFIGRLTGASATVVATVPPATRWTVRELILTNVEATAKDVRVTLADPGVANAGCVDETLPANEGRRFERNTVLYEGDEVRVSFGNLTSDRVDVLLTVIETIPWPPA